MNFQQRKQLIVQTVDERGTVDVHELAELLQTSEMTVRRDLVQLAASGLLYRTRGGAMKVSLATDKHRFANKTAVNAEQKDYICQLAAREIQDGDVIFMDCGSTVFRLCPFIRNKRITVVTNSLPVVAELMYSEVTINLVGGEVDKERQALHGLMADEHIARYRANRAFIGVDGISLEHGLERQQRKGSQHGFSHSPAKRKSLPALRFGEIRNQQIPLFCATKPVRRVNYRHRSKPRRYYGLPAGGHYADQLTHVSNLDRHGRHLYRWPGSIPKRHPAPHQSFEQ